MFLKVRRVLLDSSFPLQHCKEKTLKTKFCNIFFMLTLPGKGRYLQATVRVYLHSLVMLYKEILLKCFQAFKTVWVL